MFASRLARVFLVKDEDAIERLLRGVVSRVADMSCVLPRRWVVESSLAWLNRNRRLGKDFETSIASAESWILMASVKPVPRRLA